MGARAMASSMGEGVPRGKDARDRAIMPLSTSVKSTFWSALGAPTATTRVISVVPPRYWPPESINSRPSPSMAACACGVAR
ncbi:Uncharacterised protein [Bordetella pertussis]|nr:Uncharacterised protein [Bordetella pertussis]CFO37599.1 Uncharacterised protein [Bordetella pertussis]CFP13193.1 Uncharacterised protein [Bordetella pertussis]CFP51197.1 Uncharacterised protein [Bordetella pertussis]CFU09674.1 Uncharacterised protein [Bordetella pertussis]